MSKKVKLSQEYHDELWERIAKLEARKVCEEEIIISVPVFVGHYWTHDEKFSLVEAIETILDHLGLKLEKKPEQIVLRKKENK